MPSGRWSRAAKFLKIRPGLFSGAEVVAAGSEVAGGVAKALLARPSAQPLARKPDRTP
jgi:hypothetical protein